MLACRQVNSTVLTVLAWADKATVFGVTDNPNCGNTGQPGCSGKVDQVMFNWYLPYLADDTKARLPNPLAFLKVRKRP